MRNLSLFAGPVILWLSCAPVSAQSLPHFGLAVDASTLGAGLQAATTVTQRSNVRVGFNYFTYSRLFQKDGIAYQGKLNLRSAEVLYDQYIVGGFHVSPGLMFYGDNRLTATASVQPGLPFTLGGTRFYSDAATPVTGTGTLPLAKTAPMILIGFGNLLPRNERHFTVNFELGVVFQQAPAAALNLSGSACAAKGAGCQAISANTALQAAILSEQNMINSDLSLFKYYPVVSLSFGYRF